MREEQAKRLLRLFPCLSDAYLTSTLNGGVGASGKVEAQYKLMHEPVGYECFLAHLNGTTRLGLCPILSDGYSCSWGVVDVDLYNIEEVGTLLNSLPAAIAKKLVPYRTKSGGWHLFLFLTEAVNAGDMRTLLSKLRAWLPVSSDKVDIRPDQSTLNVSEGDRGSMGTYVTLPVFDSSFEQAAEWIKLAEESRISPEAVMEAANEGDFGDGPPCLFPLVTRYKQNGLWENRNYFLYQCCILFKRKFPSEWKERVRKIAGEIVPSPKASEVEGTIQSVEKHNPKYICNKGDFPGVCNKALCMVRTYGVESRNEATSMLRGSLSVIDSDPKVWFITVVDHKGKEVRMDLNTDQLHKVIQFKKRFIEVAKVVPTLPKQAEWEKYVGQLLETVTVIPVPVDMTAEATLQQAIWQFYTSYPHSPNPADVLRHKMYTYTEKNQETGEVYHHAVFTLTQFKDFLLRNRMSVDTLYPRMKQLEMSGTCCMSIVKHELSGVDVWAWDVIIPREMVLFMEKTRCTE